MPVGLQKPAVPQQAGGWPRSIGPKELASVGLLKLINRSLHAFPCDVLSCSSVLAELPLALEVTMPDLGFLLFHVLLFIVNKYFTKKPVATFLRQSTA